MIETICVFEVKRPNVEHIDIWTVGIDLKEIPKIEEIEEFEDDIRSMTTEHQVLKCNGIVGRDFKIYYNDGKLQKEDFESIFDVEFDTYSSKGK